MKFKDALQKAGLRNPGRTTWSGVAIDGTAVFTVWSNQIHQIENRWFAWWDHDEGRSSKSPRLGIERTGRATKFIERAAANIGKRCRAVIVHPKPDGTVASAEYPHPAWAVGVFRAADLDALQFIVELLPPDSSLDRS